jgi:hypothetical protein
LSTVNTGATSPDPLGYTYGNKQGTSMATPHVAGIASLMLSVNPSLTPSQVASKLSTTARAFPVGTGRDCTTALCGAGIVDAAAAVLASGGSVQSTTTTLATSATPATFGSAVTFTATVAGSNPSGSVGFADSGSTLTNCGNVTLTGSGNSRSATCTTSSLAVGTHSIVANYSGDAANAASSSPALSQVITAPATSCAAEIVIDNLAPGVAGSSGVGDVSFTGNWAQSGASGWFGVNGSLYSFDDISVADTYTWRTPVLNSAQSCTYGVYVWWTMHPNRATSVPITVSGQSSGASTQRFNQQLNGSQWVLHGTYTFAAGARASVQVANTNGQAAADAVRFVLTQ